VCANTLDINVAPSVESVSNIRREFVQMLGNMSSLEVFLIGRAGSTDMV